MNNNDIKFSWYTISVILHMAVTSLVATDTGKIFKSDLSVFERGKKLFATNWCITF